MHRGYEIKKATHKCSFDGLECSRHILFISLYYFCMHMDILFFVDKYVYKYCTYVVFQCHVKGYMILILYQNKLLSLILNAFDNFWIL